jgi:SAM-dependent methyltransferase
MKNHGSDKGGGWHNYTTLYSKLFHRSVSEKLNIFELGLGTNNTDTPSNMGSSGVPGASLFAWSDYFTNSSIYGADIDRRILFSTERIKTYYCDQRDENSINELYANEDLEEISFDIILEDGLHEFSANHNFLIHSIGKLKKNGIFIVEDLNQESFNLFKNIIEDLKYKFSLNYINVIKIPNSRNSADNALLLIQK